MRKVFWAVAMLLGLISSAQAATLTNVYTVGPVGANVSDDRQFAPAPPVTRTRSVFGSPFDTSLGTLNSVQITVESVYSFRTLLSGDRDGLFSTVSDGDGIVEAGITVMLNDRVVLGRSSRIFMPKCNSRGSNFEPRCPLDQTLRGFLRDTITLRAQDWYSANTRVARPTFDVDFRLRGDLKDGTELRVFGQTDVTTITVTSLFDPVATTPPSGPSTGPMSPVPLPAGLPLLLVGLGAFGVMKRRTR